MAHLDKSDDRVLPIDAIPSTSTAGEHTTKESSRDMRDQEEEFTSSVAMSDNDEGSLRTVRRRKKPKLTDAVDDEFVFLDLDVDNEIEAHKMEQNYMFGFKKWKSHVTKRPLDERSDIVKTLYEQPQKVKPKIHLTLSVGNVLYAILIGWWLALIYLLVALLMLITIIGWKHAKFCVALACYFLWPFGKFVKEKTVYELEQSGDQNNDENKPLLDNGISQAKDRRLNSSISSSSITSSLPIYVKKHSNEYLDADNSADSGNLPTINFGHNRSTSNIWKRPSTYVWLILGCPLLLFAHALVILVTWLAVIFIPISKLNIIAIRKVLLLPPEKLRIHKTSSFKSDDHTHSFEVVMCSYQAVNFYYYKYTVDGMNVILVNMLIFVLFTIVLGYADSDDVVATPLAKFIMGLVAIIPLAYYIGMGITSISAQSSNAVGAVLNATFGSIVELILYVSMLLKMDPKKTSTCYNTLVKSGLVGTLLVTMLLIPGISMVVGGIKHSIQHFNMKSASVSSTLLFISIAGMFSPTIFNKVYGIFACRNCMINMINIDNSTLNDGFRCSECIETFDPTSRFYKHQILPLVYICASLQLLAYIVGLIFTLKTHAHIVHKEHLPEGTHEQAVMHWGRIKSIVILLCAVVMMSLCAEVVVKNIEPVLKTIDIPDVFFGVTFLAIVPDIPEIINGIQFALKNNVNLSIEIGSSVAVQVTLLQVPVLILVNAIYPLHFYSIFSDVHMWSVIISALIMNYIFIDGKSNYFQGAMLCIVYFMLLSIYFFASDDKNNGCIPG